MLQFLHLLVSAVQWEDRILAQIITVYYKGTDTSSSTALHFFFESFQGFQ